MAEKIYTLHIWSVETKSDVRIKYLFFFVLIDDIKYGFSSSENKKIIISLLNINNQCFI